jgi:hypothetical protein
MIVGWWLAIALADDRADFLAYADAPPQPPAVRPVDELPKDIAESYRTTDRLWRDIAAAVRSNPSVAVERVGESGQARPIWAFHVHDPRFASERSALVLGGLHALEWIGTEVAADVLLRAIHDPPPVDLTVVPLFNPDGRYKVEADLRAGRNAYRRGNAKNVDLNRDYPVNATPRAIWQAFIPGYYAHSATPLSQPESAALDRLASREHYDRAVSLHSFGGFLYYPWSGRYAAPRDRADFRALGRAMQQAQGAKSYTTRQLSRWAFPFRAQGTELDHLYGEYGTRTFLIELTRSGLDPWHPRGWRTYFRWYNPRHSEPHRDRGVRAVWALITTPTQPGEREHPAGTPPPRPK